ncbi:MAG: SsrA-binding protein SmpB [Magnetococcales bacterium]|nr:SsrA-binding protein SmpB [Magnetococcales bacterium]
MAIKMISDNRKAGFNYEILDRFEVGIVLTGTEVKSLRSGRANIGDSYAILQHGELFWLNGNIPPYSHGTVANHDPLRTRKLLAHRYELKRLIGQTAEKGLTLIPLKAYWKDGRIKLEIGICRGKKTHDKRDSEMTREWQREKERWMKQSV